MVFHMKKEWSAAWKSSTQPRKQRKYRYNAPLHVRRAFMAANLSKALRERYGRRSMPVSKGDEVVIMRGDLRGTKGMIEKADVRGEAVYIEGVKRKKVDGSDVARPVRPSNIMITALKLDDKRRQAVLERSGSHAKKAPKAAEAAKPASKPAKKDVKAKEAKPAPAKEAGTGKKAAKARGKKR
jgi:large subunit ribosomal protein L24